MEVTLKEHLEKLIDAKVAVINERMDATDKALNLANETLQARFHQINALRQEVTDDRINFADKDVTKILAAVYAIVLFVLAVMMYFK